jgi:hypothetical protein
MTRKRKEKKQIIKAIEALDKLFDEATADMTDTEAGSFIEGVLAGYVAKLIMDQEEHVEEVYVEQFTSAVRRIIQDTKDAQLEHLRALIEEARGNDH